MRKTIVLIVFICGIICGFCLKEMIKPVKAEVAGMDSFDLRYDYDFRRAVKAIIEHCEIDGTKIHC